MTDLLNPAPKSVVATLARRLSGPDGLAPLSARRLSLLIELMNEAGYIGYAATYSRLFPDSDRSPTEKTKAGKAFHKFRQTLKEAAAMHKTHLELQVDANRNADPAQRRFWFAAADDAEERLTGFNEGAIGGLVEHPQEQTLRIRSEQPSYLLLYAEEEKTDARALHGQLRTQLQAYGKDWTNLDFHRIPVGEKLEKTRADYLEQTDLILLLLSPRLIAELRRGHIDLPVDRPLLPLALIEITDDQLTGTPLADCRIFRDAGGKAWKGSGRRETWAAAAAQSILARVDQLPDPGGSRAETPRRHRRILRRPSRRLPGVSL